MFNPNPIVVEAFTAHCTNAWLDSFAKAAEQPPEDHLTTLQEAISTALGLLARCDCPYHNVDHTIMVTDAGLAILKGQLALESSLSLDDWLHAVVAMLFHDVGYLRDLLPEDEPDSCLVDHSGERVSPPADATDAWMMPYHVTRGDLFVRRHYADHPLIDVDRVAGYIEMTRFPVPKRAPYQQLDTLGALVRAADLIGQMGDPDYVAKLSSLFVEFRENGEADRLGFASVAELRADSQAFFSQQISPYLPHALKLLRATEEGRGWIVSLHENIERRAAAGGSASAPDASRRKDSLPGRIRAGNG